MRREEPIETVRGEVVEARVLKEGWGRARLKNGECIMGTVLGISTGDTIEARGRWSEDARYGKQFKAQTIRTTIPSDSRGAIAWLSSRLPGLGAKRATELVQRFGVPNLYEVIAQRPEELCSVKGITPELAEKIRAEHERVKGEAEEMTTLLGWITDSQVRKCKELWGKKTLAILREDPYRLAEEISGFGFKRSDEIARKMGLPHDHPSRIRACIVHVLREAEGEGHCYVPRRKLLAISTEELGVRVGLVGAELDHVLEDGRAVDEDERVYLPDTHDAERDLALRLGSMIARAA